MKKKIITKIKTNEKDAQIYFENLRIEDDNNLFNIDEKFKQMKKDLNDLKEKLENPFKKISEKMPNINIIKGLNPKYNICLDQGLEFVPTIFTLLTEEKEFKDLKKGVILIVKFSDYYLNHTKNIQKNINLFYIYKVKHNSKEIILRKKSNIYFNYEMYLNGESCVEKCYLVEGI